MGQEGPACCPSLVPTVDIWDVARTPESCVVLGWAGWTLAVSGCSEQQETKRSSRFELKLGRFALLSE